MWEVNYFSYTIQIGLIGTWIQVWMKLHFLRLILPDLVTFCKYLSNWPIYAVLNTYNLDMILQLKNMPIVMNPGISGDGKS